MNFLFSLSHPAHFHLFKYVIKELEKQHEIKIIIKSKDVLEKLMERKGFSYTNLQKKEKNANSRLQILFKSILGLLIRDLKLIKIANRFKPDVMIGTEWSIVHVGKLMNIPSLILNEDDTTATPENMFFYPLATSLLLPDCCDVNQWNKKKISYAGYHELSYLHPNNFTPNKDILKRYGIEKHFSLIRLVKLTASHDVGKTGITNSMLSKLILLLESVGQVIITSEKKLDSSFETYRLAIDPNDMHHIMAFANIFIGDSQTMAAEASVLGTPAVRFNDFVGKLGYLEELEHKYQLTYGIKTSEPEKLYLKIEELIHTSDLKLVWRQRREKMLNEKINVSAFIIWFIENYPDSVQIMKNNPDYQYRFAIQNISHK